MILASPLLTHSVSLTDLVFCVGTANMASALCLGPCFVSAAPISTWH